MLFDILIRTLTATGLSILINADDITVMSTVMSVCVFLLMECSQLFETKYLSYGACISSFVITEIFFFLTSADAILIKSIALLVLLMYTCLSLHLYENIMVLKESLHKTRDDSTELESILREKNKRLLADQDREVHLATLAERNRIARDIHDNVGHLLSRAILLLGAIKTVNTNESISPQLNLLSDTLDESMAKMRSSVHDLHDDSIDLKKNINEILGELRGFKVKTELDLDKELSVELKLSIIGILKESITNIIKHSNGSTVSIILHQNYNFCTLSITDNGTLDEAEKTRIATEGYDGIGLNNIKNRAKSLGGDAYFYTNDGFTVFARLPFN